MPKGLNLKQKVFAKGVFTELIEKYENQEAAGAAINVSQSVVSKAYIDGTTTSENLLRAAVNLGRLREALEALDITGGAAYEGTIENPELVRAVDFLRGQIPDAFLNDWISAKNDQGWAQTTRDDFVTLIRAAYITQPKIGGIKGLERGHNARRKKA